MTTTRREFVGTIALGTATGVIAGASLLGKRAGAQTRAAAKSGVYDDGIVQLHQNESARGPGPKTLEAIRAHTTKRVGRGYPADHVAELREGIAGHYGVTPDHVQPATGSSPLLVAAVRAFCSADRKLVIPMPTYSTSLATARTIGAAVQELPLDRSLSIDLDALAAAAPGAGLLYFCNPNNPTGTAHGPEAVERFVRRVVREAPETMVHIDEAYIDYARPGAMRTALPLTLELENVFITRSFSKAHGLTGLRVGYALGQEPTLAKIRDAWGLGDLNLLSAVAALTALEDKEHIAAEVRENAAIRDMTIAAFREMGCEVGDSNTNHIFVNVGRSAEEFRDACLAQKVLVGRDFPPMEKTHCRISLGNREEMEYAIGVFRKVLA